MLLKKGHKNNSCKIWTTFFNNKDLLSIFPKKLIQHANNEKKINLLPTLLLQSFLFSNTTTKNFSLSSLNTYLLTDQSLFFCLPTLNFSSSSFNKAISILGFSVSMHYEHTSSIMSASIINMTNYALWNSMHRQILICRQIQSFNLICLFNFRWLLQ